MIGDPRLTGGDRTGDPCLTGVLHVLGRMPSVTRSGMALTRAGRGHRVDRGVDRHPTSGVAPCHPGEAPTNAAHPGDSHQCGASRVEPCGAVLRRRGPGIAPSGVHLHPGVAPCAAGGPVPPAHRPPSGGVHPHHTTCTLTSRPLTGTGDRRPPGESASALTPLRGWSPSSRRRPPPHAAASCDVHGVSLRRLHRPPVYFVFVRALCSRRQAAD